jgi:Zn finger protein HypA/HybF involved in hydrogenase expression
MHESGIVRSLVARAETVVAASGVARAARIGVSIGALSGVDPEVVRAHWRHYATELTGDAALDIVLEDDPLSGAALGVSLVFVDVAS